MARKTNTMVAWIGLNDLNLIVWNLIFALPGTLICEFNRILLLQGYGSQLSLKYHQEISSNITKKRPKRKIFYADNP